MEHHFSFLVYMIYNKSIWKYKGEESGYMEKAMEKIKNMKNGTASEKQYRVRRCRYTDLAMVLVIAVSIQCFARLEYAGERYMQSRNGYKIAGGIMEGCGRKTVKGYVEIKVSCVSKCEEYNRKFVRSGSGTESNNYECDHINS